MERVILGDGNSEVIISLGDSERIANTSEILKVLRKN